MSIDISKTPRDFFYIPGVDRGLSFLNPPEWYWREESTQIMCGFAALDDEDENQRLQVRLDFQNSAKKESMLVYNSALVHIDEASFHRSFAFCRGKGVLSGSAGNRLRTLYYLSDKSRHQEMVDSLSGMARDGKKFLLRSYKGKNTDQLPVTLEARNLFNYYHFITEMLPQLVKVEKMASDQPIYLHTPGSIRFDFPQRFIETFFPQVSKRLVYVNDAEIKKYRQSIGYFSLGHFYYLLPMNSWLKDDVGKISDHFLRLRGADNGTFNRLFGQSCSQSLFDLRDYCRNAVADVNEGLPARFYVGRKESAARPRSVARGDELRSELVRNGFEELFFEDLSPAQQVAAMVGCKVMVAPHGAGITNTIFASSDTHVIELGNITSAGGRWNAFSNLARVAGCRHTTVFADCVRPSGDLPKNALLPVALTTKAIDLALELALADSR